MCFNEQKASFMISFKSLHFKWAEYKIQSNLREKKNTNFC